METKMTTRKSTLLLFILLLFQVNAKKHRLALENEERKTIDLTTFGFLKDSFLQIEVKDFTTGLDLQQDDAKLRNSFGFTLDKMESSSVSSLGDEEGKCALTLRGDDKNDANIIVFTIDFAKNQLLVNRHGPEVQNQTIYTGRTEKFDVGVGNRRKRSVHEYFSDSYLLHSRRKRQAGGEETGTEGGVTPAPPEPAPPEHVKVSDSPTPKADPTNTKAEDENQTITTTPMPTPLVVEDVIPITNINGKLHFRFFVRMTTTNQQGMYRFAFQDCYILKAPKPSVNFTIFMIEKNGEDNYLSAGQIPLPMMYFVLCVVFLGLACFWLYVLKHSSEGVYKMHYLMLSLIYIKSLALLFHAINYYFLATEGHHEEAIAIIYYITYLMRGILLFVTIILIGAGWAFVKHILSDREKKIFLIIIPLQILANVAQIFTEETEEGESQFLTWKEIFIIVDLLCCGAILFPVVWSIRHLQEASQTDGKAAINLAKLKLFRHFYILIVCYIYFTRIIIYLLNIAVPFQYEWIDELFKELATMVFYIVTGYKFRPASDNPYLQVPQESDDEVEMDEVITQAGALEGLSKVNVKVKQPDNVDTSCGVSKRESSHDYD